MLASQGAIQNSPALQIASANAKKQQDAQAALVNKYYAQVQQDLQNNNFSAAFTDAEHATLTVPNNNPLLHDLLTPQGINQLDPGKTWSQQTDELYYQAATNHDVFGTGLLGQNQYGGWGDPSKYAQDATTNYNSTPGGAPNVEAFAGTRPPQSFVDKWGLPIIGAALTAATLGTGAAAGAALGLSGAGSAALGAGIGAGSAVFNDELTGNGTNLGQAALFGGLGGGLAGGGITNSLSGSINSATGLGTTASGALAGGLVQGGTGALKGAVTGQGALQGFESGALSGAISGAVNGSGVRGNVSTNLQNAGLPSYAANALTSAGISGIAGGLSGALTGQGAVSGAEGGALKGGLGSISGSILSGAGTIFQGTNSDPYTSSQTNNSSNSSPSFEASNDGNNNGYSPTGNNPDGGYGSLYDAANSQYDSGAIPNQGDPLTGISNPGYDNLNVEGGGTTLGGGYGNGSSSTGGSSNGLLSSLAGLLTGGSGNGSNSSGLASLLGGSNGGNGLLAQLLGAGTNAAAGVVNQKAAQGAAQTYANQTAYNPYAVNTSGGSANFNGTSATTSLSPSDQQTYNGLQSLADSSASSLQAGPQAAQQQYYNQLQASQADANNKYFQNNLDSQFANGILSSTAGQYQSQAALANISQQQLSDQVAAANYSNTQQQNQLSQLTAGLNGFNAINSNQNTLASLGGSLGYQASNANLQAYKPLAGANANSPLGNILSSIGNQYNNSATSP